MCGATDNCFLLPLVEIKLITADVISAIINGTEELIKVGFLWGNHTFNWRKLLMLGTLFVPLL
jgi:hypothetical protein